MAERFAALDGHREAILLGEIGALLHMFGKCSSEFLRANSSEGGTQDSHQDLKHLPHLTLHLQSAKLRDAFAFELTGREVKLIGDFTDFITKYKRYKGSGPDSALLKLFNTCHRMTSADEKGVVRRPQSVSDICIITPFGYRTHTIDLSRIDTQREEMDRQLAAAFEEYLSKQISVEVLRHRAIDILRPGFSLALGETRQPANDVTLWAQSSGVASLYKPVLATLAMGLAPCPNTNGDLDYNDVRWRLLGIGWNGLGFVQRGRRPGDILKRQEILLAIAGEIQALLEVAHPVGNQFYADLNGLFFTFPGIEDSEAEVLVGDLAPELIEVVRTHSNDEVWPFFTLSKPRRTLTVITNEIGVRDQLAALPKVATFLSLEHTDSQRQESLLAAGPALTPPGNGQDICPICQFRSKRALEDACPVCQDRRSNRQAVWQGARHGQTIWVDEVADKDNRIALLTLRFVLSRWLNGEWLTTIWSQTLTEWAQGERLMVAKRHLRELVQRGALKFPENNLYESAHSFAQWVLDNPTRTECKPVLEAFLESGGGEYQVSAVPTLLQEIEDTYGARDAQAMLKFFFTQNPSPARLERIWEGTEAFLSTWIEGVEAETFASRPQRLRFTTASAVPGYIPGGPTAPLSPA